MLEGWGGANNEGRTTGIPQRKPRMHNQGHIWIAGTMLTTGSNNDPAFFHHHANVDRIYQSWLENSGQIYYANEENGGKPAPADYPAKLTPLTNAACKAKYPEYRSMVKMQSGQCPSSRLLSPPALLAAMGGSVLPGRGRTSGRPVTDSSGARASRHQSRLFPSL